LSEELAFAAEKVKSRFRGPNGFSET